MTMMIEDWKFVKETKEDVRRNTLALKGMEKRISAAEMWMIKQIDGIFVWDISKVDERRNNGGCIYSEYFYQKMQPYKMSLRMFPNGDDTNVGTGFTIFLIVHNDFRDRWTKWPFAANVTITISNKATEDVYEMITKHCIIERPSDNSYKWSDAFLFSYSNSSNDSLLAGNRFVVECIVSLQ